MRAIETRGQFDNHLSNKDLKIDECKLKNICLIEVGAKTCRYIMRSISGSEGFICTKNTPMKKMLDELVEKRQMVSVGDNCIGLKSQSENIGEIDGTKQAVVTKQDQ